MTHCASESRTYRREYIAEYLDELNYEIDRHPERWALTSEERAEWATFPALARAHRYPTITLDPNHPIANYMRSGFIGPNYKPNKPTMTRD